MISTICLLIFCLAIVTEGITPNEQCFLAAKNAICFLYYPLQYKSCVERIEPYYDHVSFFYSKASIYTEVLVRILRRHLFDLPSLLIYYPYWSTSVSVVQIAAPQYIFKI